MRAIRNWEADATGVALAAELARARMVRWRRSRGDRVGRPRAVGGATARADRHRDRSPRDTRNGEVLARRQGGGAHRPAGRHRPGAGRGAAEHRAPGAEQRGVGAARRRSASGHGDGPPGTRAGDRDGPGRHRGSPRGHRVHCRDRDGRLGLGPADDRRARTTRDPRHVPHRACRQRRHHERAPWCARRHGAARRARSAAARYGPPGRCRCASGTCVGRLHRRQVRRRPRAWPTRPSRATWGTIRRTSGRSPPAPPSGQAIGARLRPALRASAVRASGGARRRRRWRRWTPG